MLRCFKASSGWQNLAKSRKIVFASQEQPGCVFRSDELLLAVALAVDIRVTR